MGRSEAVYWLYSSPDYVAENAALSELGDDLDGFSAVVGVRVALFASSRLGPVCVEVPSTEAIYEFSERVLGLASRIGDVFFCLPDSCRQLPWTSVGGTSQVLDTGESLATDLTERLGRGDYAIAITRAAIGADSVSTTRVLRRAEVVVVETDGETVQLLVRNADVVGTVLAWCEEFATAVSELEGV